MEVHHHPDVHHKKKKFKEYFLEFLMIFLAVTMGFFAESLREKMAVNEKGKIYITGIIKNLEDDTAVIRHVVKQQTDLISKMDSALQIPVGALSDLERQDSFYRFFIYFFTWVSGFEQNDNTLVQLRNAGGFSIIDKQPATDSIIRLNRFYNIVNQNRIAYLDDWKRIENLAPSFIRIPFYPSEINDPVFFTVAHHVEYFTKYDESLIEQLYTMIRIERGQLQLYTDQLLEYKKAAGRLIGFLKKEYRLENE